MLGSHSATMPLVNVFLRNESGSHSKKGSQNINTSWPFTFYPQMLEVTISTFDFGSLFSPSPKKKVAKVAENCPKLRSLNSFWVLNFNLRISWIDLHPRKLTACGLPENHPCWYWNIIWTKPPFERGAMLVFFGVQWFMTVCASLKTLKLTQPFGKV